MCLCVSNAHKGFRFLFFMQLCALWLDKRLTCKNAHLFPDFYCCLCSQYIMQLRNEFKVVVRSGAFGRDHIQFPPLCTSLCRLRRRKNRPAIFDRFLFFKGTFFFVRVLEDRQRFLVLRLFSISIRSLIQLNLIVYGEVAFSRVVDSNHRCPTSLREMFADLRDVVAMHFPGREDVQRLALSSFIVMRFFAAAIMNPRLFGLKREQPVR